MKLTGNEDLRVRRTIESIRDAFSKMICEMDYEKMTVKELCERAKINKKTFYTYYSSLDELLVEFQEYFSSDYSERIAGLQVPKDMDKLIRAFFMYSVEKGEVYEKITCADSYEYIRSKMINNVMKDLLDHSKTQYSDDEYKQRMLSSFIEASGMALYRGWVADGKKLPIEEAIKTAQELVCKGVWGYSNS